MSADAAQRLRGVRWVGGGSGAGKSTVARALADRHSLAVYSTDDAMGDHATRTTPDDAPYLHRFLGMTMDERWLGTPQDMVGTFHWFRGEGFPLVVEDLLDRPGVLAEGFRLLPRLVRPLLTRPGQAVWLLPTPDFRRAALRSRGSEWAVAGRTSDPDRALGILLERDRLFTDRLAAEAAALDLPVVRVDTDLSEDQLTDRVADLLGL